MKKNAVYGDYLKFIYCYFRETLAFNIWPFSSLILCVSKLVLPDGWCCVYYRFTIP